MNNAISLALKTASHDVFDRACEWVAEHYPDLMGDEYEAKILETINELKDLDFEAMMDSRYGRGNWDRP